LIVGISLVEVRAKRNRREQGKWSYLGLKIGDPPPSSEKRKGRPVAGEALGIATSALTSQ
jgi:hypothetical protein